jgi:hypothetical protein
VRSVSVDRGVDHRGLGVASAHLGKDHRNDLAFWRFPQPADGSINDSAGVQQRSYVASIFPRYLAQLAIVVSEN